MRLQCAAIELRVHIGWDPESRGIDRIDSRRKIHRRIGVQARHGAPIVELPLQGRQVTDLITLAGAAIQTGRPNSRSFQGGVNPTFAPATGVVELIPLDIFAGPSKWDLKATPISK